MRLKDNSTLRHDLVFQTAGYLPEAHDRRTSEASNAFTPLVGDSIASAMCRSLAHLSLHHKLQDSR